MKKKTKRLLSSVTAGLFVLQSIPFMAVGSSAVGDTALKSTPTIDGQLDAAYLESYSLELNNSNAVFPLGGSTELAAPSGTVYYLYDDNYLYMAAQIHDETISTDSSSDAVWQDGVVFSFFNSRTGNGDWNVTRDARIRISPTANQINVSNRNGEGAGANLPATDENVWSSLADFAQECACSIDKDNNTYTVELRVQMDTLNKGDFYQIDFSIMDKYGNNGEDSRIYGPYSWAAPSCGVFSLGDAYEGGEVVPPVQVGGNGVAVKGATPTIDGTMDEAYGETYCYTLANGSMKLLYDADYIYMFAEINDTSITENDYIQYSILAHDSTAFWSDSDVYKFTPSTNSAIIEYSWRNAGDSTTVNADVAESEFSIVTSETGYKVEARIAKAVALTEGRNDLITGIAVSNDGTVTGDIWSDIYNGGNFGNKGEVITLGAGEQPPVDDTPVVKKGTPVLDGQIDLAYLSSASMSTKDVALAGNLQKNWASAPDSKTDAALKAAGIVVDGTDVLSPDGDYSIPEFTYAETYFLWDDGALYVCSKVYDNDIMMISPETAAGIVLDSPWLIDGIRHYIYPEQNIFAPIPVQATANGTAVWEAYNWDEGRGTPWSTLGDFVHDDAEKRLADLENVAATVNADEGYYVVEIRIPFSDKPFGDTSIKDRFLTDGNTFAYGAWLVDSDGQWQTAFGSQNRMVYQGTDDQMITNVFKLSAEAASEEHDHVWADDYTVDTAATCTAAGSESIHCTLCGAIKEDSVREIPMLEHTWEEVTVKEATCTEAGSKHTECSVCKTVKEDSTVEIPMLEHAWEEEYTVDKAANCTEEGSESIHCANCDAIKEDSSRVIEKIPHSFVDGVCEVCGEKEQTGTIGDVNGDGSVDARDLSALMKLLADEVDNAAGDINGDGSIDARDLSALMKLLAEQE